MLDSADRANAFVFDSVANFTTFHRSIVKQNYYSVSIKEPVNLFWLDSGRSFFGVATLSMTLEIHVAR